MWCNAAQEFKKYLKQILEPVNMFIAMVSSESSFPKPVHVMHVVFALSIKRERGQCAMKINDPTAS